MNKQITLSILTAGLLFMSGCGSNSTSSLSKSVEQQAPVQSFKALETRGSDEVNHAPKACDKTFCLNKDTNLTEQLVATDEDNDTLTYEITSNDYNGTVDLNQSTGIFTYTPEHDYVGTGSFTFVAKDEHNATSQEKRITLVVKDVESSSPTAPVAPENLEAIATSGTSVKLKWEDKSDNETKFIIYQDGVAVKCVTANTQEVTIDGLEEGKTYKYTVRARNEAGCSEKSNEVEVTTLTATVAPHAPTGLEVVAKNKTCVRLKWNDNSDNESGFNIYKDGVLVKTVAANSTCTTISGLKKGTSYEFEVKAVNSAGESEASKTTATTDDGANEAPVAYDRTYSTYKDTNLTSKLCASDPDGDALTYTKVSDPSHGSVEVNTTSGEFVYSPEGNYTGEDSFTFQVSDETNSSEVKTATIKVCDK